MEKHETKTENIIARLRKQHHLSQEALADKLHISRQAVSRWETNVSVPSPETLRELAALLGVSTDLLLGVDTGDVIDGNTVFLSYANAANQTRYTNQHTKERFPMTQTRKLRIGVFGGARGQTMIDVLLHHPDAELVAVCDKYTPLLDSTKKKAEGVGMDIAVFEHFEDFIAYDMDAVVLANYAHEHAVYAVKCLHAGKHVLSEVLPCETMAQAVALIEAVEETGLVYAYAENYCYMTHTFEMWRRFKSGELGSAMYGEGEYIHDCSAIWPQITYGERDHWRNRLHPNFYCTHSLGPLITMTGLRPVQVVGFEPPLVKDLTDLGCHGGGAGLEMVTMENGAVFKSIHGGLKREPGSINYELYGTKGMMETGRLSPLHPFNLYKEGDKLCQGSWEQYEPTPQIAAEAAKNYAGHGGSDFYPTHFFIEKILGRPDGEWTIDVYTAVDMGICGLLAYRSVLAGNKPMPVPNLRNKDERDAWRNDNACCTPEVAGDQLLPATSHPHDAIPDSVYEYVKTLWLGGKNAE